MVSKPYEKVEGPNKRVYLSCEHGSNKLPKGLTWGRDDWLSETHWAWDIGAADLTRELAAELNCGAHICGFSRLYCGANRPEDLNSIFLEKAEGRPVFLNRAISPKEREDRIANFHRIYHSELKKSLSRLPAHSVLLSLHSFTPCWQGNHRELEVGVLFNKCEEVAVDAHSHLRKAGIDARLNEPYSGKADLLGTGGMIYAAENAAPDKSHFELEVRNDLAVDPAFRKRLIQALSAWFQKGKKSQL